jgi:hypothetical protein
MVSKIACFVLILLVCLTIPVFAQTGAAPKMSGSAGVMFASGGPAGPYLNFDTTLSSRDAFDVSASAGVGFFSSDGVNVTLVPVMLNLKSKATSSANTSFGGGLGMVFAGATFEGMSGSGSFFGYQLFATHNFSPKTFGELKLVGISGLTLYSVSYGMNF